LIWFLLVLGAISASIGSIVFVADPPRPEPAMFWMFWVGLGIAIVGLVIEARHDRYAVMKFLLVASLPVGVITFAVWRFGETPHPVAAAVAVACAVTLAFCTVVLVRSHLGREILPNVLARLVQPAAIVELDGVQFAVRSSALALQGGQTFEVEFLAQNCWSIPRTVQFGLKLESRFPLARGGIEAPPSASISLPGGAVGSLKVTLASAPDAGGKCSLLVDARVDGNGGVRVRRWHAQTFTKPLPAWARIAAAFGGLVTWGGGMRVRLTVRPTPGAARPVLPPPAPCAILWEPTAPDLQVAGMKIG